MKNIDFTESSKAKKYIQGGICDYYYDYYLSLVGDEDLINAGEEGFKVAMKFYWCFHTRLLGILPFDRTIKR